MNFLRKLLPVVLTLVMLTSMALPVFATEESIPANIEFTEVNEIVYAIAMVNVRTGPGLGYNIITTLSYGDAVRRIGIGSNGWSKVIYQGQEAYMYSTLISTNKPVIFGGNALDDSALKEQLGLANGLIPSDYTVESWSAVSAAMTDAEKALNSGSQNLVDEACEDLKTAIGALVKVNYTDLDRVLLAVDDFAKTDAYNSLWEDLVKATQEGREALTSGDQAAVDAITQKLQMLLDQMEAIAEDREIPGVVIQEVPVEVPPTSDFCNIPQHRAWPVVAIISLAINLGLLALIGYYIIKKQKTQRDDTPLVDYDIDDDTF